MGFARPNTKVRGASGYAAKHLSRLPGYAVFSQVSDLLALGQFTSPFKENVSLSLLQESHIGTILSPVTSGFMTCAPSVGVVEQSFTEQLVGQDFPEKLSQCCFHVPHLHARSAVPPLFFQPVAESPISFSLFSGCDDEWHNLDIDDKSTDMPSACRITGA